MSKQILVFLLSVIIHLASTAPCLLVYCPEYRLMARNYVQPIKISKVRFISYTSPNAENGHFGHQTPRRIANGRNIPFDVSTVVTTPIYEDIQNTVINTNTDASDTVEVNRNTETNNLSDSEILAIVSHMSDNGNTNGGPFSSALLKQISHENQNENVIVSPFSIQAALTLLYMGAKGDTEEELRTGLRFTSSDKLQAAENVSQILNSKSDGLVQLKIANKIYAGYELDPKFNNIAKKYFKSEAETVNFADSENTVNAINSWVEEKTNNKITDLLSPNAVDKETTAVLVNAIYFKAQWAEQFNRRATSMQPFWLNSEKSVDVNTMFGEISCKYGEFPQFDATAIELRYEDNEMALLIVLPNKREGLKELEAILSNVDMTKFTSKMNEEDVEVRLPQFKIEFNTGLVPILEKMGMKKAFSSGADYSGLFNSNEPVKVSDVVHKAFIEVNEYGSEAAAATYVKTTFLSSISSPKTFTVDHPFLFAIKNSEAVYFAGHVVKF